MADHMSLHHPWIGLLLEDHEEYDKVPRQPIYVPFKVTVETDGIAPAVLVVSNLKEFSFPAADHKWPLIHGFGIYSSPDLCSAFCFAKKLITAAEIPLQVMPGDRLSFQPGQLSWRLYTYEKGDLH